MSILTCDEGRDSPADQVVEPHRSVVDVSHFADHAVNVQPLQEEPGERAEVEKVQQDGDDRAEKLSARRTVKTLRAGNPSGEKRSGVRGYRVVGLVDAQDEDELGQKESRGSVVDDARLVALHGSEAQEEDCGEEEEAQRHSGRAPGQDFNGQDLSVLRQTSGSVVERVCVCVCETLRVPHLPPGDVHQHSEAGHVITLAADVAAVPEHHLAAFGRPAAVPRTETTTHPQNHTHTHSLSVRCVQDSQYGVVPEHTDGLRALLGGDQAKLHGDGFVQRVLQQLVVVVNRDADHRRVDDRTLRYTGGGQG